jgi:Acyl-CoA synthetases (AMP-forming)/AMP-acid ligases II
MSIPLSFLNGLPSPPPGTSLGDLLAELVTDSGKFNTLLDCLCSTTEAALHSPDPLRPSLRHDELRTFVTNFTLPHSNRHNQLGPNDRVMIALPTGPENALALLALASYHTCAPINAACTASELMDDAERLNVKAVLTTRNAEDRLELRNLSNELGLDVIYIHARPSGPAGLFDMTLLGETHDLSVHEEPRKPSRLHGLYDQSLVVQTSGASGDKKVVPYTLRSLIVGTWAVVQSWDLQPSDVNSESSHIVYVSELTPPCQ